MGSVGYHELLTLVAMVVVFAGSTFAMRLPVGVSLVISALAGAIVGGSAGSPLGLMRHMVEGGFAYLDAIMTIGSAMIFMKAIEKSGLLSTLAALLLGALGRSPFLLLGAISLLLMFPGMMTGSSTAAVLTTGALVCPVLLQLGIPRAKAGAIIALSALLGMIAPPVSIPALIIGAGVDLPYVGLDLPLFLLSIPLALIFTWGLGYPHCRMGTAAAARENLPTSYYAAHGFKILIPLIITATGLVMERYSGGIVQLGLPVVFLLGAASAAVTGERFAVLPTAREAMSLATPVLAILVGVGMFIQVMTLTGARGEIIVQAMQLPRGWTGLYPAIGISLPLFGAVSSFGAASVLGVPFVLALPMDGSTIIINVAAIVLIVGLGDLVPPTALASIFAAQVVGEENYLRVLRHCIAPALVVVMVGLLCLQFAAPLGRLLVRF